MEFASKNSLVLDSVAGIDVSSTGVAHTTNSTFAATLGQISQLTYKRATVRAQLISTVAATVDLNIKAGGVTLGSESITLAIGENFANFEVDLSGVAGSSLLLNEVDVTSAGAGTVDLFSMIDIETPLVIGSC